MRELWLKKGQVKSLVILILMTLIVLGVGVTYAYNQHNTQVDNFLKASQVAGEIIENGQLVGVEKPFSLDPGYDVEKRVQFKNTGEAPVFVRISFGETWLDSDGKWLTNDNEYATLYWTEAWAEEWQLKADGWYYYKKILKPDALTSEILTNVEFDAHENLQLEYQTAKYQLFFTMEVVQCSADMTVNDKALKATFGRGATITEDVVIWE